MGLGGKLGRATTAKLIKYLQYGLSFFTIINMFMLIIPFSHLGNAEKELKDLNLMGDTLFRPYFLDQIFQTLNLCCWFSFIFLFLGAVIHANKCHHRETACLENPCPPSSLKDPVHQLRPILILYIIFILCCALLQIAFGAYLLNLTPNEGVKDLWVEDSNLAEERRTAFIQQHQCCGWDDIFEYQLQPECNRQQLIASAPPGSPHRTCSSVIDSLLEKWIKPIGEACVGVGVFEFVPWGIMVMLNVFDKKDEIQDTTYSAGG